MPTTLTFTLDDIQFTPAEKTLAMDSLGKNAQNLQDSLNNLAKAAFMEYINMLTARGVPLVHRMLHKKG